MIVSDLQQLLDNVGRLLDSAGAKREPVKELAEFREGLAPFRDLSLKKLTDLLAQADAAARGAPIPVRGGRKRSAGGQAKPDPEAMAREVKTFYDRATDPAISEADITALVARLEPLTKDALLSVAAGIELKLAKSKSKDSIIGEIRQRILARKSVHQRAQLLDRPGEATDKSQAADSANGAPGGALPQPSSDAFFK